MCLRRFALIRSVTTFHFSHWFSPAKSSRFLGQDRGYSSVCNRNLSPLFSNFSKNDIQECKIELVDDEAWRISSGIVDAWRCNNNDKGLNMSHDFDDQHQGDVDLKSDSVEFNNLEVEFDEIEDMRIRGNLFYKLDKDSKEYEEYKFDFHRRKKSARNERDQKDRKERTKTGSLTSEIKKEQGTEIKKNEERRTKVLVGYENKGSIHHLPQVGDLCYEKKKRTPTFNQLTAPYHEPFCLDIFISNASARASIIHRATSKVVAVSHSISKDLKFDLGSTKNRSACAAVGEVLAHRALADDIYNVVYTPRKGEKLEGKLKIVLQSIIDGGVDVKVKFKQKKSRKGGLLQRTNA